MPIAPAQHITTPRRRTQVDSAIHPISTVSSVQPTATMDTAARARFDLIGDNLAEILNPEIVESVLVEGRNPRIYWGTATTGRPHSGYFVPAIKIAQLLASGCEVVVLLADIHAFLDNLKAPLELVENRAKYYRKVITAILEAVGVSTEKLEFVLGSSYQKDPEYVMDVYRLSSLITEHDGRSICDCWRRV